MRIKVLDIVVEVVLHGDADEMAQLLGPAWARCMAAGNAEVDAHIDVRLDSAATPRRSHDSVIAPSADAAMELLTQAITLVGITAGAGSLLMFHAAGLVELSSKRSVLLVGPSGIGKSTAARHLGREWGYLSDETVAVREDGSVIAYPKPLSLRLGGRWKRQVGPDALGLMDVEGVVEPARILLLERGNHDNGQLLPLPLTEAVAALAEHTSYLAAMSRPLHRVAGVVSPIGCARALYSTTEQLQALVRDAFEEEWPCV